MSEEKQSPSYYAVIPANVRYDKKLKPNAKLLYGELTALANMKGYCWSGNKYFAELYGVTNSAISKWISQLNKEGYIDVVLIKENGTQLIKERHIYINDGVVKKDNTPIAQKETPYVTNVQDPIGQMCSDNNTLINNTINNTKETSAKPPSASKVKYEESNPYYQLANYLYQSILRNDPKAKQPNMQTWSDEIRKLVEIDKRDIMDVKDIVTFATNHHFWKKNILSTKKLRDKFSTLYIEFNDKPKSYEQKKYQQPKQQVTSKEVIGTDDINHPNYNWANYNPNK